MLAVHPITLAFGGACLLSVLLVVGKTSDNLVRPSSSRCMRAVRRCTDLCATIPETASASLRLATIAASVQSLKLGIALTGDHGTSTAIGTDARAEVEQLRADGVKLVEKNKDLQVTRGQILQLFKA